jgi:hypothetical protein
MQDIDIRFLEFGLLTCWQMGIFGLPTCWQMASIYFGVFYLICLRVGKSEFGLLMRWQI